MRSTILLKPGQCPKNLKVLVGCSLVWFSSSHRELLGNYLATLDFSLTDPKTLQEKVKFRSKIDPANAMLECDDIMFFLTLSRKGNCYPNGTCTVEPVITHTCDNP